MGGNALLVLLFLVYSANAIYLPGLAPVNYWERLSSQSSLQQHLLDDQQRSFQMQQQHGQDQKVVEALVASQQQQHAQYEAFLNQMFNMQRKAGHEITQQQMAYAQQYMKELGY